MADGILSAPYFTLQSLMWPEAGICTERELYVHTDGPAALSISKREVQFIASGTADFGTWFNLFNAEKWKRECGLSDLALELRGEGTFELTITLAARDRSWESVLTEIVSFDDVSCDEPLRFDLQHILSEPYADGLVFFALKAMSAGKLNDARWVSRDQAKRCPSLNLAVTTFRREDAVARTMERFESFMANSAIKDHLHLTVTDNGQTLADHLDLNALPSFISVVPNANLGGAGGFTRGLLETRDRGDSHCLFMDDDASIHMESIERTWTFLAYANDPNTAVSGAMISEARRWAIWENGALFFERCRPLFMNTDLRDPNAMTEMEQAATPPVSRNFYAGWWYFAFPVDAAEHLAFPFFVRGDDVSFSLANGFNTVTLNGVVSFQESFTEKESPLTWYLDLRSHMAHHLSLPDLDVGKWRVLKIAVWFLLRNLPRMHYESIAAINLAMEDVISGPDYFDKNADVAARRADIKALTNEEAWLPLTPEVALPPHREAPTPAWHRTLMKLTLNGHLLPGFKKLGKKILLTGPQRGYIGVIWGASEITYLNTERTKYYTVRHSKAEARKALRQFAKNAREFLSKYDELVQSYRGAYGTMTSEPYWREKLGMNHAASEQKEAAE